MTEPHETPHPYDQRKGLDWCRVCGEPETHLLHEETTMKVDYSTHPILRFFEYRHLSEELQEVSKPFRELAWEMAEGLPPGPEVSAGLRKLLEAKDCFVRAAL